MEVRTVSEQNTLYVRTTTPVAELPQIMGTIYGEIAEFMQKEGVPFTGPPFALYHNMDMQALDVEIGFPVPADSASRGNERVQAGKIPGGKVLAVLHTGPYSAMEETYTKAMAHIEKEGLKVMPWMYEAYLNDPGETPPEQLQTEIFFPLEVGST